MLYPSDRGITLCHSCAIGFSADALLSDDATTIKDKELLKKFEVIQDMNEEDKAMVTRFLDLTIRDYKAKQAYSS